MASLGAFWSMIYGNPISVGLFQTLRKKDMYNSQSWSKWFFYSIKGHSKAIPFSRAWKRLSGPAGGFEHTVCHAMMHRTSQCLTRRFLCCRALWQRSPWATWKSPGTFWGGWPWASSQWLMQAPYFSCISQLTFGCAMLAFGYSSQVTRFS